MFLRAGFNPRRRRLRVYAFVYRAGRTWVRFAQLVQFRCGDFAWEGTRGISWPESIGFAEKVYSPVWRYDLPQSVLPA